MKKLMLISLLLIIGCGRRATVIPHDVVYPHHRGPVYDHRHYLQQQCNGQYTMNPTNSGTVYNVYCGTHNPGQVVDWNSYSYGHYYHYQGYYYHFWY